MSDNRDAQTDPVALATVATFFELDTTGYESLSIQITGTWAGTCLWEQSNDKVNWLGCPAFSAAGTGSVSPAISTTGNGMWVIPISGRFFRVRRSVATSGTATCTAMLRALPVSGPGSTYIAGSATLPTEFRASSTASGATSTKVKSAASTNLVSIKTSAGNLLDAILSNNSAADKYIKFYNKTSAPVIASDTAALLFTMLLPAKSVTRLAPQTPVRFATGIAYAITGGVGETDVTATAVDDVTGVLNWV